MTAYDIYESVSAGFASPGEEQTRYSVDLERYIIEHPTSSLVVSGKGDSMIEAGIFPGDIAVVDKARIPNLRMLLNEITKEVESLSDEVIVSSQLNQLINRKVFLKLLEHLKKNIKST